MQLPPDDANKHDAMAGVTPLTSMCTAVGPYVCNSARVGACVCVYMLCKYEPRYGYMSACILIPIDFSNSLIVAQYKLLFF